MLTCAGHPGITQKACAAKGCCWQPFIDVEAIHGGPRLDLPACFHPNTHASVYTLEDASALAAGKEVRGHTACRPLMQPGVPCKAACLVRRPG